MSMENVLAIPDAGMWNGGTNRLSQSGSSGQATSIPGLGESSTTAQGMLAAKAAGTWVAFLGLGLGVVF